MESLTQRVAALEAAQKTEDDAVGQESVGCARRRRGRGLRLFNWMTEASASGRGQRAMAEQGPLGDEGGGGARAG